jgi:hypothetical protein
MLNAMAETTNMRRKMGAVAPFADVGTRRVMISPNAEIWNLSAFPP